MERNGRPWVLRIDAGGIVCTSYAHSYDECIQRVKAIRATGKYKRVDARATRFEGAVVVETRGV